MPNKDILLEWDGTQGQATAPNGVNHLLVIAIDDYVHCPKLNNCVRDGNDLAKLLWEKYMFDKEHTYFLLNSEATRTAILGLKKIKY